MKCLSKSSLNFALRVNFVILFLSMVHVGCSKSETGNIGSATKANEITAQVSQVNVVEGQTTSLDLYLAEAPSSDMNLSWIIESKPSGSFVATSGSITVPAGETKIGFQSQIL